MQNHLIFDETIFRRFSFVLFNSSSSKHKSISGSKNRSVKSTQTVVRDFNAWIYVIDASKTYTDVFLFVLYARCLSNEQQEQQKWEQSGRRTEIFRFFTSIFRVLHIELSS